MQLPAARTERLLMKLHHCHPLPVSGGARRRVAQGVSLVELLVGIAVGMFVLAGASMVVSNQLTDNRRLLLETQIQQDMRAALDIISRDIRRSGYWSNAYKSVLPATTVLANPYESVGILSGATNAVATNVYYTYSHDHDLTRTETDFAEPEEHNGFELAVDSTTGVGTIMAQLSSASPVQPLTDPNVLNITQFDVQVNTTKIDLPVCATPPCAPITTTCGATASVYVRSVDVTITGEAVHDSNVKRTMSSTVRLRNDQVCR